MAVEGSNFHHTLNPLLPFWVRHRTLGDATSESSVVASSEDSLGDPLNYCMFTVYSVLRRHPKKKLLLLVASPPLEREGCTRFAYMCTVRPPIGSH